MIHQSRERTKRWRVVLAAISASIALQVAACSSSSSDDHNQSVASASGGTAGSGNHSGAGGSSTGGHASSGGAPGAGGAPGTGGAPAHCAGVDAGGADECLYCLATNCCAAAAACLEESACADQFSTYQACVHDTQVVDPAGCFSAFTRNTGEADAAPGTGKHEPLYTCVLTHCHVCGAPGIL